jgi:hypothetical protein
MRNGLVGLLVIGLAVVAWRMVAGGDGGGSAAPEVGRAAVDGPATRIDAEADAGTAASRAVERAAFADPKTDAGRTETRAGAEAIVRGRCVDGETSAPLADCKVAFNGAAGNPQRLSDHVARHGNIVWTNPPAATTGKDGRFEFRFAPPPPYQFFLTIDAADRVPMTARWPELAPGAAVDLGDVAMRRGVRLRGRVVDTTGAPQPNCSLSFAPEKPAIVDGQARARDFFQTSTDADGRFSVTAPVCPGAYALRPPRGARSISPDRVVLEEGAEELALEVTVALVPPEDVVTGVVVDESGAPIVRARVEPEFAAANVRVRSDWTGKDGAFRLEKPADAKDDPFAIVAEQDAFESGKTSAPVDWGARDVRIVMRRRQAVEVTVIDGDRDRPLETYAVRCFPSPATVSKRNSDTARLRAAGRHENGVARVEGVLRGTNWLIVEPTVEGALPSPVREFEASEHGAAPQRIVVRRPVARTVTVRRTNGAGVVSTEVELLRAFPGDGKIDAVSAAGTIEQVWMGNSLTAQTLGAGATDESGSVELRGPPGEKLFVRALGPGHAPICVETTFDDVSPLVIEVPTGATFEGSIGPPELVARLAKLDGVPAQGGGVSLTRLVDGREERLPLNDESAPLSQSGGFRMDGVPPGDWEVRLDYERTRSFGSGTSSSMESLKLGRVALTEGEVVRRDYDLPHLVPARVTGTVRRGGLPAPDVALTFAPVDRSVPFAGRSWVQLIRTDAEGRYAADLFAGDYRCFAQMRFKPRPDAPDEGRTLFAADIVSVAAGESAKRDIVLPDGALRLTILAPDGKTPVEGVRIVVKTPVADWPLYSPPTDAQGTTTLEGLPPGSFAVLVVPKPPAAGSTPPNAAAARPPEPIEIGTTPASGSTAAATFVLPAAAGY